MSNVQPITQLTVAGKSLPINPDAQKLMLTKNTKGEWTIEEVASIGESDLLVIRNESGLVKAFKKTVRLYEAKKEIARVSKSWIVTVQGYNRLNQFAGLHEITPPEMMFDGKPQSNPRVQYDQKGEIKKVIVRKIVIGYTVAGSLVATDVVRHYNFDAYYMQDLQNKAKWKKDAAKFGTELSCPFAPDANVEEKNGIPYVKANGKIYLFKRVKDIEGIWIDPAHDEIREVYDQHIQHQKFGDVIAQNVASRNAKKAHPGIAATNVIALGDEDNHYADVQVFGYRSTISSKEAEEIASKIVRGEQVSNVEVNHSVEDASFEEVKVETTHVADDAAGAEGGPKDEPAAPAQTAPPVGTQEPAKAVERPAAPAPATSRPAAPPKTVEAKIAEEGEKKGIDPVKMAKNLFGEEVKDIISLNEFQKDKLLKVLEKTMGGKNGGAK